MLEREGVSGRKRRSRREINQLVVEFESSGLRQSEFCHQQGLALSTLQRGLKRRRREVGGPSEGNPLVEVKVAGIKGDGSGPETCALGLPVANVATRISTVWHGLPLLSSLAKLRGVGPSTSCALRAGPS
jgi:hypothetical protein